MVLNMVNKKFASTSNQCFACWWYDISDDEGSNGRCRAYPLGIPSDIFTNRRSHDRVQEDQINEEIPVTWISEEAGEKKFDGKVMRFPLMEDFREVEEGRVTIIDPDSNIDPV
jgi:hypothetical protein